MKPSLRIALYCRTSPSDPHGAGQEQALRQAVAGAGGEIVGVWHSTATATREHCSVRQVVLDLARSGKIDAVWVTALTRWSRSLDDLAATLNELHTCRVALIVPDGPRFEPATPEHGALLGLATTLARFEFDLRSEWVQRGIQASTARGYRHGRQVGQLVKTQGLAPEVMARIADGQSYVEIARALKLSKNTITAIVRRHRQQQTGQDGDGR